MKQIILTAVMAAGLLIKGCTDNYVEVPGYILQEFNSGYAQSHKYSTWPQDPKEIPSYCSIIEYKNGKVSKVIHKNSIPLPQSILLPPGQGEMAIDEYHEVHYRGNIVELIKKVDKEGYVYTPQKVQLTVDETGKIIERTDNYSRDTTFYYYSENGLLEESISRNDGYSTITRRFFFDSNRNLIQITGTIDNHDETSVDYNVYEYFELYDNGINGFKDLGIIEGAFIRSLSQNNFNQYRYEMYNDEGILQNAMRLTLEVRYDENNYPIYGDCSLKDLD